MLGESLVRELALPLRRRIEPLLANPRLGAEELRHPFRYNTDSDSSRRLIGYYSNCCGTAAYVLGLSDAIGNFRRETQRGVYMAIPCAERPGYIGPPIMTGFVKESGILKPVSRYPKPGDLIIFQRRGEGRIIHSGIYLGAHRGHDLFFCQYDHADCFGFSSIDGFIEEEKAGGPIEFSLHELAS